MRPTDHFIDIGIRLHIRQWEGNGGATPFVLLHGLSSNCRTWERVAEILNASGHPVITVDQRGHGLSAKPDTGYDFETIAEDLVKLIGGLGLVKPVVAGQSWGGNGVLAFGAAYPGVARGLCFVDGGFLDMNQHEDNSWESISVRLRPPTLIGMPRRLLKDRISRGHPDWTDEGIEATLANFETLADGTVRPWLTLDRHMTILRALWEQRPGELFPQVQEPVLICPARSGDPDWSSVKAQQVAAAERGLPHSRTHWFENTDHDIHVHRPEALAAIMLDALTDGFW
jgi:pimeloyl-ACP methyl ester carboxylesterase